MSRFAPAAVGWMRQAAEREWAAGLVVVVLLATAAHFYLAPASNFMWARDRGHLMSDGGDATTLPFNYHAIQEAARESPRNLLYGAIYNPQLGAPFGSGMWVPWIERWLVVIFGAVLPVEAIPTAFVWVLMVLAGLCVYAFGRMERWPKVLAFSLALAYAFNPYTRARASVHDALVGIYCLPLLFVGLHNIRRKATPKRIAISGLLFVLSVWSAHYYIIILAAISPLFLWFQLRRDGTLPHEPPQPRAAGWKRLGPLSLAALPAVAFLAWNVLHPLPPNTPPTKPYVPPSDAAPVFMNVYAARPIDYFSNDVAFGVRDLNPLRQRVNKKVGANLDGSNPPERSNGIRWSILIPFLILLVAMCTPGVSSRLRKSLGQPTWRKLKYWTVFALLMFVLSLSPQSVSVYQYDLGLSSWIHFLFHEFRVPSRCGPFAHFAVLVTVGTLASAYWDRVFGHSAQTWRRNLASVVPLLMVLDYPPLLPVPIAATYPPRTDLAAAGGGNCGVGFYFPYSAGAGSGDEVEMYRIYQQLRDTNCRSLQQPLATELHEKMLNRLGHKAFRKSVKNRGRARVFQQRFVDFAQCAQLDWVVFRDSVPEDWRVGICQKLGWVRVADDACSSLAPRLESFPDPAPTCLPLLQGGRAQ